MGMVSRVVAVPIGWRDEEVWRWISEGVPAVRWSSMREG